MTKILTVKQMIPPINNPTCQKKRVQVLLPYSLDFLRRGSSASREAPFSLVLAILAVNLKSISLFNTHQIPMDIANNIITIAIKNRYFPQAQDEDGKSFFNRRATVKPSDAVDNVKIRFTA